MHALAFTLDDAPSVQEPGVSFEAARMDRCREILTRRGVAHCVAFVVGARALGHERALERWLMAGFELGNHTHVHEPASRQSAERFAESLARCDELLQRVGAFAGGGPKWFRFPHLDRGRDPAHRRQLALECEQLGYRIAPATIDLFDYPYEAPLVLATSRRNERDVARVEQRFLRTCLHQIEAAAATFGGIAPALRGGAMSITAEARAVRHVAFAHFGPIAERNLDAVLDLLRAHAFELCSLSAALDHPVYRSFEGDFARNGLVIPAARRDLRSRIRRGLAIATWRLGSFDRGRYGPLRPY
jgi:peptidoglycan/xylan/chitin deacetylase (PgdA/CDA1 family)